MAKSKAQEFLLQRIKDMFYVPPELGMAASKVIKDDYCSQPRSETNVKTSLGKCLERTLDEVVNNLMLPFNQGSYEQRSLCMAQTLALKTIHHSLPGIEVIVKSKNLYELYFNLEKKLGNSFVGGDKLLSNINLSDISTTKYVFAYTVVSLSVDMRLQHIEKYYSYVFTAEQREQYFQTQFAYFCYKYLVTSEELDVLNKAFNDGVELPEPPVLPPNITIVKAGEEETKYAGEEDVYVLLPPDIEEVEPQPVVTGISSWLNCFLTLFS